MCVYVHKEIERERERERGRKRIKGLGWVQV